MLNHTLHHFASLLHLAHLAKQQGMQVLILKHNVLMLKCFVKGFPRLGFLAHCLERNAAIVQGRNYMVLIAHRHALAQA